MFQNIFSSPTKLQAQGAKAWYSSHLSEILSVVLWCTVIHCKRRDVDFSTEARLNYSLLHNEVLGFKTGLSKPLNIPTHFRGTFPFPKFEGIRSKQVHSKLHTHIQCLHVYLQVICTPLYLKSRISQDYFKLPLLNQSLYLRENIFFTDRTFPSRPS